MNRLHQIPIHMLLLAGLISPSDAKEKPEVASSSEVPKLKVQGIAYAGLNVGPLGPNAPASIPSGVGIQVGFIDPKGPSFGKIEEGDILTRLDDQMLFNAEQFISLVRMRQAGDNIKLTLVRGAEPMVISLQLATRPAIPEAAAPTTSVPQVARAQRERKLPPGVTIVGPNSIIPSELLKQLQELQSGMLAPPAHLFGNNHIPSIEELQRRMGSANSQSFTFSFGGGTGISSSSIASDDEGTVSLQQSDGKRHAVVKDPTGKILFEGDVTDPAAVEKLPEEIRRRLKLVEAKQFDLPTSPAKGKKSPESKKETKSKYDPTKGA